ncbi:hypothetical protein FA10DRAFT_288496 [Acaromyces ingoldii]|uniref:SURP motif domain-containing protein n=1 Tax=Acaromyces ingoldii TaxID=215250 RepID=A0A316YDW2_9BASI|nr:hypothetical protein FA10DRAFT_288496 [Acaromyces ingoldii]PWN87780.1 hypothetical protein FA10DRAFT_288496 [Acaromyces ingoldii]
MARRASSPVAGDSISRSSVKRERELQKRKLSSGHGDPHARRRISINDDEREHEDVFHLRQLLSTRGTNGDAAPITLQAYEEALVNDEDMAKRMAMPASESSSSGPGFLIPWRGKDAEGRDVEIWTDRYDALHLLSCQPPDSISTASSPKASHKEDAPLPSQRPTSPGWSDLDSDSEDMYFLTAKQVKAHYTEKHRRRLASLREQRISALEEQERAQERPCRAMQESGEDQEEEAVSQAQMDLMKRTARAMRAAGNPKVLEMKILANHGSDGRFAFLSSKAKGRAREVWQKLLNGVEDVEEREEGKGSTRMGMGQLAGYESESDDGDDNDDEGEEIHRQQSPKALGDKEAEARKREARLQRAREWSKRRREEENARGEDVMEGG